MEPEKGMQVEKIISGLSWKITTDNGKTFEALRDNLRGVIEVFDEDGNLVGRLSDR